MIRVWKIEEVGECCLVLESTYSLPQGKRTICPNPTDSFIKKHGRHDLKVFMDTYAKGVNEVLYTKETLIVYFKDKVPDWAEVGMEVIY